MEFGGYTQSLIIIFIILGFLTIVLLVVKKYGARFGFNRSFKNKNLYLEDHIALGPKRNACVVVYKGKKFLLGVTDNNISLLSVLDDRENEGE